MKPDTQIAKFAHPFPAKVFEFQLDQAEIDFTVTTTQPGRSGKSTATYKVAKENAQKALQIKAQIEREEVDSNIEHMHPSRKYIAYLSIITMVALTIYKLYKTFK